MINEIYIDDKLMTDDLPKNSLKDGFKIKCISCKSFISRKWYDKSIFEKPYECKSCVLKNKNPMHNPKVKEKHTRIVNSDEYRSKMSKLLSGENNPFYGKTHSKESIEKVKRGLEVYWKDMDDETRREWSEMASKREHKRMKDDLTAYRKQKARAARASHKSQFKNMKMNKIEKIVYDYLNSLNLEIDYSPVLASYQYDFIIRNKRILIEVDGDYWHGNPKFYNVDGSDGKRKLNEIQLSKKERDVEKTEWAISRGFSIIRIWEDEINNGTFKKIIENEIKKN